MKFRTRKLIKPEDLNARGTLFGGQVLKWIDEEASIFTICQLGERSIVTKAMSEINFVSSAKTGDIIEIGCELVQFGNTSSNAPHSLMRVDLYMDNMEIDVKTFVPVTFSSPPIHTHKKITKDHIKNPSIFIQTLGSMMMYDANVRKVLDYLDEIGGNVGARGGMSGGIINQTMNAGTSVTYSTSSNSGLNGSSGNNLW